MSRSASIALGPYQLLERIGEGGSGTVYRANGPTGPVAIKMLGLASDMDDAARARFGREIAALGQIVHPNIVALIDHGIDGELGPYLVLRLLPGTTLRTLCAGHALSPEAALLLIQPIALATAALHAAGYVHRDLKPENAIAGPDGSITVIDLGLAWSDGMTRHTDTGAAVGSVGYMSPEQIEGRSVDARTDVWAIGVMIYEWIVGKRPFARARPAEEAGAVLLGTCPRLSAADRRCSEHLVELVGSCLAVDPERRPSAAELARAITTMIDWTDAIATERAAVVADPVGYQARVEPFLITRIERLAREAIEAGKPFAALAACDRGLAYAPKHPALLALVATAEAATSRSTEPIAAPPAVATTRRARRWPWLVAGSGGMVVGAMVVFLSIPDRAPAAPAANAPAANAPAANPEHERDVALVRDFISFFDKAITTSSDQHPQRPPTGATPTTASGWLALASAQPPAEAVASLRHALALSPTWIDAQVALCMALAATSDDGALAACDVALQRRRNDVGLQAARGAARLHAGQPAAALEDLDRVVAADPHPKWRRLRARARSAAGDRAGARRDLESACQLGDAAACREQP